MGEGSRDRRRFLTAGLGVAAAAVARATGVGAGQSAKPKDLSSIPSRLQRFVDAGTIAGAVCLVQQNGEVLRVDAVGWRDLAARSPMRSDTVFQVMSQSKPFIATAVLILQDEGRLDLDDPVEKYLPEFADPWLLESGSPAERLLRRPTRKIVIADVLAHASGMADAAPATKSLPVKMRYSLAEVVGLLSQQPLEAEPGTRWHYSNQGIAVAARIVEVVSGRPFEEFVEQRIFAPLEMSQSSYRPRPEIWPRIASAYELAGGAIREMGPESPGAGDIKYRRNTRYPLPEAGIFSTAGDMAKFHQLFLDRGERGVKILSPQSIATMLTPRISIPQQGRTAAALQALGWRIQPPARPADGLLKIPAGSIYHSGAFGSFGWADPSHRIVGIFLVQRPDAIEERNLYIEIVDEALASR